MGATFNWGSDCSSGDASFQDHIAQGAVELIGEIPMHKKDVRIELTSTDDVDIQLIDPETGIAIIKWPSGMLNGAGEECVNYEGVEYCYSGYDGVQHPGDEWIEAGFSLSFFF